MRSRISRALNSAARVQRNLRQREADLLLHVIDAADPLRARLLALDAIRAEYHDADGWTLRVTLPEREAARLAALDDGVPLRGLLAAG